MTRLTYRVHGTDRADDWRDEANCKTTDPEAFFTENAREVRHAQSVCRGCPVWQECREFAIRTGERWGVWGGMTQTQLRTVSNRGKQSAA